MFKKILPWMGERELKIAICSQGPGLDCVVDQRFGRCFYYVLVSADQKQHQAVPNPSVGASGGAGVQAAQFLVDKGVNTVLVGNIGPKALAVLNSGGVKVYTGISGTVAETLEQFQQGKLRLVAESTVPSHFGLGRGGGGRRRGFR
ncbi:MAG: NifB/NifX family molybdenum-iron cluster-binding protein [Bacillota bacterium]|jgi:predicted Fe-Mo cluster-binding NifX family protein|nr:NifB/NifX family molybdenum-iron cluster-binding protein [Bacillota bacterium]